MKIKRRSKRALFYDKRRGNNILGELPNYSQGGRIHHVWLVEHKQFYYQHKKDIEQRIRDDISSRAGRSLRFLRTLGIPFEKTTR